MLVHQRVIRLGTEKWDCCSVCPKKGYHQIPWRVIMFRSFHPVSTITNLSPGYWFPTCQVRVLRFYISCPVSSSASSAGPQLQALDRSDPRRTQTASSGSKCSPQTSTASSGSEGSPLDFNHKESPEICQIECQKESQKICQNECLKRCQIECQIACQIECQN